MRFIRVKIFQVECDELICVIHLNTIRPKHPCILCRLHQDKIGNLHQFISLLYYKMI